MEDNSVIKVLTKLDRKLYGHPFTKLGNHKVMSIAQIAIVDAGALVSDAETQPSQVYVDDTDMSKLEGNLNIFWYGGAALLAGVIVTCSQLLGG